MTDAELLDGLNDHNAMIVHLSHYAKMREGGVLPTHLRNAIANKALWSLSCVVLWPGHAMSLPGSIGVIFRPRSVANIVSVSGDDLGSTQLADGVELSGGNPLSADTFKQTFQVPEGRYNEWRIKDADVVGIFVASEHSLSAKKNCPIYADGVLLFNDIVEVDIPLQEVFDTFPDLPIYTMTEEGPHKLREGEKPVERTAI